MTRDLAPPAGAPSPARGAPSPAGVGWWAGGRRFHALVRSGHRRLAWLRHVPRGFAFRILRRRAFRILRRRAPASAAPSASSAAARSASSAAARSASSAADRSASSASPRPPARHPPPPRAASNPPRPPGPQAPRPGLRGPARGRRLRGRRGCGTRFRARRPGLGRGATAPRASQCSTVAGSAGWTAAGARRGVRWLLADRGRGERRHHAVVLLHHQPAAAHVDRLALLPLHQHRRGDEDRRVGARGHADEQGEREVPQRLAAEQHQRADRHQHQKLVASDRVSTSDIERFAIWENVARGMRGTFSRIRSNTMIVS